MDFMSYQVPLYQPAFPQHDTTVYSQDLPSYADSQHLRSYQMPRRSSSMSGIRQAVSSHGEKNETKPRLAKDEVEILESHFRACNKPNSQVKRELAEQFGVEPARINNWFQNRRAKAKQERKQLDYDLRQTGDMTYPRPHSADGFGDEAYDERFEAPMQQQQSGQLPILGGPPPAPVASFHPRYDNPSAASMHSLQRTIQEAEAAANRGDFDDFPSQVSDASFGESLYKQHFSATDRVQFPTMNPAVNMNFDERVFESEDPQSMQATASQDHMMEAIRRPFPSQMLDNNGLPAITYQSHVLMPVPQANDLGAQEGSDMRFKSPPPPTDLAGRRSKPRPAALGPMSLREHIGMGPRSVSSNDIPKRMNYSPLGSPMRRIQSNGGGLNVIGGRIQKVAQSQRSPLAKTFAPNYDAFLQDYASRGWGPMPHTAGACFGQEFPPTPSSPYAKSQVAQSISDASSPVRSEPNYIFNPAGFDMADQMSNIASPPETPHNAVAPSQWGFEVADDALHTPVFGMFSDASMSMPQPQYVSPMSTSVSASQPATPALGSFNGYMFQAPSPQFDFPTDQQAVEYHFPDGSSLPYGIVTSNRSSPVSQSLSKSYTFSHMTAESLKEQQKKGDDREKTPVSKSRG